MTPEEIMNAAVTAVVSGDNATALQILRDMTDEQVPQVLGSLVACVSNLVTLIASLEHDTSYSNRLDIWRSFLAAEREIRLEQGE